MNNLFKGRVARLNYFLGQLVLLFTALILCLVLYFVALWLFMSPISTASTPASIPFFVGPLVGVLVAAIPLTIFILNLSLSIRRLHDMGWSGWGILLGFIPFVSFILLLFLLFKSGSAGENDYGQEPPKEVNIRRTLFPKAEAMPPADVSTPLQIVT